MWWAGTFQQGTPCSTKSTYRSLTEFSLTLCGAENLSVHFHPSPEHLPFHFLPLQKHVFISLPVLSPLKLTPGEHFCKYHGHTCLFVYVLGNERWLLRPVLDWKFTPKYCNTSMFEEHVLYTNILLISVMYCTNS